MSTLSFFNNSSVVSFITSALVRGGRVVDLGRPDMQAVIWTQLNPLTDSVVVFEVLFQWNSDKTVASVSSQFRDHDGEGEMIPHQITQGFDGTDVLSAAECYYQFHEYMGNQKIELATRVAINNAKCA